MANDTQFSLPTDDIMAFDRQRRSAKQSFGNSINNLNLSRTRAETDFGRTRDGESLGGGAFGKTRDAFKRRREGLSGQFVNRGIFNSGIFKNAVNRHFTAKNTAMDDLEIQFTRSFGDFDASEEGLGSALESALAQIDGDQHLRRSVYAELIRGGQ